MAIDHAAGDDLPHIANARGFLRERVLRLQALTAAGQHPALLVHVRIGGEDVGVDATLQPARYHLVRRVARRRRESSGHSNASSVNAGIRGSFPAAVGVCRISHWPRSSSYAPKLIEL